MWFKNLRLYRLTKDFSLTAEQLAEQLAQFQFQPCSSYEKSRIGWVSPLPDTDPEVEPPLAHGVGEYILICAQAQDRLLPASVVREYTEEKVAELEQRQARKIYRKEKREIAEDMEAQLLPQAFTRNQQIYAYLAPKAGLLVVNAASAPRAEELVSLLRDSLGSFPVALPESKRSPSDVMTHWLRDQKASDKFALDEDCELFNPMDGSNVIRCKGQDLASDEIVAHLEAGKQVKSLGVSWNNLLSCNIGDDLVVKRLRFEEMQEDTEQSQDISPAQKLDQEFALMSLELANFFQALFAAFGGLAEPRSQESG
ncbi:MAG: recombination-associated protein RdgC [Pseudohongiellaceae bacterium]